MNKIINMAAATQDGTKQSPELWAFEKGKKLIILALDDTDDEYAISWCQAGMKASEMVALLDVAKSCLLSDMGY